MMMPDFGDKWNNFVSRIQSQIQREGGAKHIPDVIRGSFKNIANWGVDTLLFILGLQNTLKSAHGILTDEQLEALNQEIIKLRDEYSDYLQNMELEQEKADPFKERTTLAAQVGTAASDQRRAAADSARQTASSNEAIRSRNKEKTDKLSSMERVIDDKDKRLQKETKKSIDYDNDVIGTIFGSDEK